MALEPKNIVDLDPLVGGMDDTLNLWAQIDGGGPGSSYAVSWAQLFIGADAVEASDDNGTSIAIEGGAADGIGTGGSINSTAGNGRYGGGIQHRGGDGYYGGDIFVIPGVGEYRSGKIVFQPATATYAGYILISTTPAGTYIRWDGPTAAGAALSGWLYIDASNFLKRKP